MQPTSRIQWIDQLKAFTILVVVMGHLMSNGAMPTQIGMRCYEQLIVPFHMPLFAILSGWFFSARDRWDVFLYKKGTSILLPYLLWCVLWYFVRPITLLALSGELTHGGLVYQASYLWNDGIMRYGWWFLRALFFCQLMAYLSVRLVGARKHCLLKAGLASCVLLQFVVWAGIVPNMPDKDSLLKGFFYLYPFFWTGRGLRELEPRFDAYPRVLCIALIAAFVIMLGFWQADDAFYRSNTAVNASQGAAGIAGAGVIWNTVWRYAVGVTGSMMWIVIFRRLPTSAFCLRVGQETLGIYILQSLVYWSLPVTALITWGDMGNFCFSLALSVVVVIVSYCVIRLTSRNAVLGLLLWGKRI